MEFNDIFPHNIKEIDRYLKATRGEAEKRLSFAFADWTGKERGQVLLVPKSGGIMEVRPTPWSNPTQTAEKPTEPIYITNSQGKITTATATRQEARQNNLRYLVVTTLLVHKGKVLLQRRSRDKNIDPNKLSASAHGVASVLFWEMNNGIKIKIEETDAVATITTALELNEELRHGEKTKPFTVRFWPAGREADLFDYAEGQKLNDMDTVWVVPQVCFGDDGFELGDKRHPRTRALSAAFVFSREPPPIIPDPAEVSATE